MGVSQKKNSRSISEWSRSKPSPAKFANAICALTLLAIATIYLLCMSPFVGAGDSGELIVTATKLATPHPPGYPLYTFFAHLFTYLPISTVAWRVGLFSVVCQLAAAAVLFQLLREWLGRVWIACAVTMLYSLSPLVWRYAMEAEVFALNNLFAVVLLFLLHRTMSLEPWFSRFSPKPAQAAPVLALALGLAATNHLTILLFALPFTLWFLWTYRSEILRAKPLALTLLAFAVGLLPYLFLFYLGQNRALYAWGDFSTWDGFFTHVLRREYGSFSLATGDKENAHFWSKIFYFAQEMVRNIYWPGVAAILYAVYRLARPAGNAELTTLPRLVLATFISYVVIFHALSNLDLSIPLYYHTQARMWILPLLLLCLLIGWALKFGAQKFTGGHREKILATTAFATVATMTIWNWKIQDKSNDQFFHNVGRTMLDAVAPGAVILMREDTYVNTLRYLQEIDKLRPDVKVIPLDALWWPWMKALVEKNVPGFIVPRQVLRRDNNELGAFTVLELLESNIDKFPIYISKVYPDEELTLRAKFWGFPYGFHSRIKRLGVEFTLDEIKLETGPVLTLNLPDVTTHRFESWETFIRLNYVMVKPTIAELSIRRAAGRSDWLAFAETVKKSGSK